MMPVSMPMPISSPTPTNADYQNTLTGAANPINADYRSALKDAASPPPFSQSSIGVTAEQSMANQPMPKTIADFTARGGISNTFKSTYNNVVAQQKQKAVQAGYEKLLQGGERAADATYNAFVKAYGDDIKNWIPGKELFYDDKTGAFLPNKYYESMYVGKQKFLEQKKVDDAAQLEKDKITRPLEANKNFSDVISKPGINQQEAYSTAYAGGTVTPEMEKGIATLPNPNKKDSVKNEIEWGRLKVAQNSARLREMTLLLNQEKTRGDANTRAMEHIVDAKKDLRTAQQRQSETKLLYGKVKPNEPVMDKAGNMLDADDLSQMLREDELVVINAQQNIDDLESLRKSRVLSPITQRVIDKAADVIGAERPSDVRSTPSPLIPVPGYQTPTRPPLSSFMRK